MDIFNKKTAIPKHTFVGGQKIEVISVPELEEAAGQCEYFEGKLYIAQTVNGKIPSDHSKYNTYNHELVHAILFFMGEDKLSLNEKFVSCFAGLLTEARINETF